MLLYYSVRIHIEYYIDVMKHTESFQRAFEMRCFFVVRQEFKGYFE